MELLIDERQDALRLRCPETGKIHCSWIIESGDEKSLVIFEDIPENYPSTSLIIEPYSMEAVEAIVDNIYTGWGCEDEMLPCRSSFYGKALQNAINSAELRSDNDLLLPVCPVCENVRLREMSVEDAEDDRIVAGYLFCDQCAGELDENNVE